jgi:hypothetical protein
MSYIYIYGFAAALRGEEIVKMDFGAIRKHWDEAMEHPDAPHVPLNFKHAGHLRIADLTVEKRHAGVFCHGGCACTPSNGWASGVSVHSGVSGPSLRFQVLTDCVTEHSGHRGISLESRLGGLSYFSLSSSSQASVWPSLLLRLSRVAHSRWSRHQNSESARFET